MKGIAAAAGSRAALARETVTALAAHSWPGNVRELQIVLANLTISGPSYGPVGPDALPSAFRKSAAADRRPTPAEAREDLEREMVRDALGCHRSVARAATGRRTLGPGSPRPAVTAPRTQALRRPHPSRREQFTGSDPARWV